MCARGSNRVLAPGPSTSPLAGMHSSSSLFTIFWPIGLGFSALFILARLCDSIARRIAPDLVSGPRNSHVRQTPRGIWGWLRFGAPSLGAAALLVLAMNTPVRLQYAFVVVLFLSFFWLMYQRRLKPLFLKGVTLRERATLYLFALLTLAPWCYFILRALHDRHAG